MIGQINLLLKKEPHLSVADYRFPELYCYTLLLKNVTDLTSVRPQIWKTLNAAVQEGYVVDKSMHPFVTVNHNKIIENNFINIGYDYEISIPVLPMEGVRKLKYYPPTSAVSTILYGGSADTAIAFEKLSKLIKQKGVVESGEARIIAAINSYPGEDIPKEYWALKICIPICES